MKQSQSFNPPGGEGVINTPALLAPKATAVFLDLSEWTLAEWRCKGIGPRYFKLGNRIRYSLAELDIWLEARAVISTSEHDAKKAS